MEQLQILPTVLISNYFVLIAILILILIGILYWIFYIPLNWIKNLDDVSYDYAFKNNRWVSNENRRNKINQIRKLRKIGIETEMPAPYPNGWYAIAESHEVKPEKALSVSCLGEQFVVFRTKDLKIFVLDAYCPHMGANLGIGGKVIGESIQCPFHQWSFNGEDGFCDNIPYSSSCASKLAKVNTWIAKEVNHIIFIWYHVENEEPWSIPTIEQIDTNEYVYHGYNEFIVNSHIQDIPENGADLAHFSSVHGASMLAGSQNANFKWTAGLGEHSWNASWNPSTETNLKHISIVSISHAFILFDSVKLFCMNVKGLQIGPSFVQLLMSSAFGEAVALQTVTPIEPFKQKVIHRFYAPRSMSLYMKMAVIAESIMFERDMNIWNHKRFANSPCLVKEDRAIKLFRNWFSQFYSENSKSFSQAKESLEW